jgi:hypothetical protein
MQPFQTLRQRLLLDGHRFVKQEETSVEMPNACAIA